MSQPNWILTLCISLFATSVFAWNVGLFPNAEPTRLAGEFDLNDEPLYLDKTNDPDTYIEQNTTSDTMRFTIGGVNIDIVEGATDTIDLNGFQLFDGGYKIGDTPTITANAFTWDLSTGTAFPVDLEDCTGGGNCAATLINARAGGSYYFYITQGASLETVTWSGYTFYWKNGTAPTTTATDDVVDIVTCFYTGTIMLCGTDQNKS